MAASAYVYNNKSEMNIFSIVFKQLIFSKLKFSAIFSVENFLNLFYFFLVTYFLFFILLFVIFVTFLLSSDLFYYCCFKVIAYLYTQTLYYVSIHLYIFKQTTYVHLTVRIIFECFLVICLPFYTNTFFYLSLAVSLFRRCSN